MAKDFRSNQIRTIKLIGSGGVNITKPYLGLLIYSSSAATNYDGGHEAKMLQDVGDDVWMFVSGSANTTAYIATQKPSGGSVLFGGDVVVSGTLYAERQVIEVDSSVDGDLLVPNSIAGGIKGMSTAGGNYAKLLVDPFTQNLGKVGPQAQQKDGTVSFNIVAGPGEGNAWRYDGSLKEDVFFHVSGSRGVRDTRQRGLALFDGDLHTSGNLSMSPDSVWTTDIILDNSTNDPPIFAQQNGFGKRWTEIAVQQKGFGQFDVEIANSGSDVDSNLKFKTRAGHSGEYSMVFSGSGDLGLDRPSMGPRNLILDGARQTRISSEWDSVTDGMQLTLEGAADGNASIIFNKSNITGSGGYYLKAGSIAAGMGGQALGFQFTGGGSAGTTTAGLYYNRSGFGLQKHPILQGPNDALVMTSANAGEKMHIGAAKVEVWGLENGIEINASHPTWIDQVGGPILMRATGSHADGGGVDIWGDVRMRDSLEIDGNLTVWGDKIIGHVISASISDPLLLLNSGAVSSGTPGPGGGMNPSGGGIAIASGSTYIDQAMVFGRYVHNSIKNTFFAGRMDVKNGDELRFDGAEPIRRLAAGYRFTGESTPQAETNFLLTGSGGVTILSGSRFALESGKPWFFSDIGTKTGAAPPGSYYMVYDNTDPSPGVPDLQLHIGTGSFTINADPSTASQLFLGASKHTLWEDDPTGFGETKFLTDKQLIVSSSDGLVLSTSNNDLVVSASAPIGPNPAIRVRGGNVFVNTTNNNGKIEITSNKQLKLSSSNIDGKVLVTAGETAGYDGGQLDSAQLYLSGGIVDPLGYNGRIGAAFVNTPILESKSIIETYPDINFFVSGSIDSRQSTHRGVGVFGGDLVVSGTAKVGALAIDNLVLEGAAVGQPFIRFGLTTDSPKVYHNAGNLTFFDDYITTPGYTLTQIAARGVELNNNIWKNTYAGGGGDFGSYLATSGAVSFDFDQNWAGTPDPYVPKRTNSPGFGGSDVFFIISGSKGGKSAEHERSTSVFRGDLLTSGAMYWARISTAMAAAQVVGPDAVSVYAKDVSGETRLFYRNEVNELPLGAGGSLDDAYDTPTGGGLKSTAAGAVVEVDGRPVQLEGTISSGSPVVLVTSGSVALISSDNSTPPSIICDTDDKAGGVDLEFKINKTGPLMTKVFSLSGGSANLVMNNNALLAWNQSETEAILKYKNDPAASISHGIGTKHFLPDADNTYNLGTPNFRWANLYTGDLHLKNERGNWTILEERDYLCVINNITGKKYKMALEPLEDDE